MNTTTTPTTARKLEIEMIPNNCWGSNLRKFPGFPWDAARRPVYVAAGHRCEVCGGQGRRWPVECHEMWSYDEVPEASDADHAGHVQRLVRLTALCPACHTVKHWGLAMIREGRGEMPAGSTLAHLCAVNGWDRETGLRHVEESIIVWRRRNRFTWDLDLTMAVGYDADPTVARVVPAAERPTWSEA